MWRRQWGNVATVPSAPLPFIPDSSAVYLAVLSQSVTWLPTWPIVLSSMGLVTCCQPTSSWDTSRTGGRPEEHSSIMCSTWGWPVMLSVQSASTPWRRLNAEFPLYMLFLRVSLANSEFWLILLAECECVMLLGCCCRCKSRLTCLYIGTSCTI